MFSNLKLGHRIWMGFGSVLGLTCALGLLAVGSMGVVRKSSDTLTQASVPELLGLQSFAGSWAATALSARSYALSGQETYRGELKPGFERSFSSLQKIEELVARSPSLASSAEPLREVRAGLKTYQDLVNATIRSQSLVQEQQTEMVKAAAAFLKAFDPLAKAEEERSVLAFRGGAPKDLLEAHFMTLLQTSGIRNMVNDIRIAGQRAQVESNPKILEEKIPLFDFVERSFALVRKGGLANAMLDEAQAATRAYKASIEKLLAAWKERDALMRPRTEAYEAVVKAVELLSSNGAEDATAMASSASKTMAWVSTLLLMGLLTTAATGTVVAFAVIRSATGPIREIVGRLRCNAEETAAASEELAAASQRLAEGSTQQASALQETASTIEELNSMIHKSAENASQSSELATRCEAGAKEGGEAVVNVLVAMGAIEESNRDIGDAVRTSNERIAEIVKIIEEIASRTKVINEIVFQTRLLSFNASVEAARAGESGKGFAVVAEEVGNLAQMSGNAAKEIEAMLAGSVAKVEAIVAESKASVERLVEKGQARIGEGRHMADACQDALSGIMTAVAKSARLATEVAQAAAQQAQGINEITSAVTQLDQVTQENTATAEESSSASERLAMQATELQEAVRILLQMVDGNQGDSFGPSRAAPGVAAAKEPLGRLIALPRKPGAEGRDCTSQAVGT